MAYYRERRRQSNLKFSSALPSDAPTAGRAEPARKGPRGALAVLLVVIILLAAFVVISPNPASTVQTIRDAVSKLLSFLPGNAAPSTRLNYTIYSPIIQNGSANITHPPDYAALADYALGLINSDRADFGLNAVALSPNEVAQQHADSMLRFSYFSHFDTQGLKPYMRYTLLGGKGAMAENIAYVFNPIPVYTTTSAVEGVLRTLEHEMMYNDSSCCHDGHRLNILTSLHNQVSIGVAYDGSYVYFVEDFENYYVNLAFSV